MGGGIASGGTLAVTGGTISENSANMGGGIFNRDGTMFLTGTSQIVNNQVMVAGYTPPTRRLHLTGQRLL
jgi:hypothetical protein